MFDNKSSMMFTIWLKLDGVASLVAVQTRAKNGDDMSCGLGEIAKKNSLILNACP